MIGKSASEPVLRQEDYHVPANGVGNTGFPNRPILCFTSKDDGTNSSRINQIIRQAQKVPGPGKYIAHDDWRMTQTYGFAKGSRDYKSMHKGPSPDHYETKEFSMQPSIGARDNLSHHRRVLVSKIPPGKRRSFLDSAERHGREVPGPGAHNPTAGCSNALPTKLSRTTDWTKEAQKSKSLKVKAPEIGPNHYTINYSRAEPTAPSQTVPKEVNKNFIDKYVREKWTDAKSKKPGPGPGHYDVHNFDHNKTSRGTYQLQLRNLSRNPASGYF
mmetsp:Transcript_24710/g.53742  ORF Transcript_24710/g.53742 Transcript_24710/m.53742 type:complete len:272 (-) Transcript_24710:134-949(-)